MMRTKKQWIFVLGLSAIIAGCNNEKDYYQNPLDNLKPIDQYFDFATKGKVAVSLDMSAMGANSIYEVYTENPMKTLENGQVQLNQELSPVYSNITDNGGKSSVSLNLPTAAKKIWIFNQNWNLPTCVELDITNSTASYTYDEADIATTNEKSVRGSYINEDDNIEYGKDEVVNGVKKVQNVKGISNLYRLCDWTPVKDGKGKKGVTFTPSDYVKATRRSKTEISNFANQIAAFFPDGKNNTDRVVTPSAAQIKTSGEKEYTNINLVFLSEKAGWHSSFGYFYYKAGTTPDMNAIHKYIIMPDASEKTDNGMFSKGETIHLQFFGENYDQSASYNFPKGYIIGWFIIADGVSYNNNQWTIKNEQVSGRGLGTTLDTDKNGKCLHFAVARNQDGMVAICVEDDKGSGSDKDYNDLCFYLEASPLTINPDIPIIEDIEETKRSVADKGTYAFEDQWPDGGDYDLNDVVTEYEHAVTRYTKQKVVDAKITLSEKYVTLLESNFTFVQDEKAATFNNAFGIEFKGLDKDIIESVTINGENATLEVNNPIPSIIVATNARAVIGKTFAMAITLKKNNTLDESKIVYNPFIVENNDGSASKRKEVHLPKQTPTALGWNEGNINQYYVDGMTGAYPFAIDIPVLNWEQVTESVAIGSKNGEYPTFRNWADSNGQTHTDWYNHK